ncbi:MAG TPA: RecQ family ATP-dependent DNA helicase, partial [Solirubrobacteraceae bacterium]|nr:RecQ family ATP-dependent DNA helicase [Solirubrobacteraceae bacterium]
MPEPLALLRRLSGPDADFRPHQREAIEDLVERHRRVLCVQATGWGKSAVYFIATALMRARGEGPTVLVSPLLALMRNQIQAAERLGIRAVTVNSTNRDDWAAVRGELERDAVDLLLISPERLNNAQFRETMLPLFIERVGLLVVDEAHCVSDWGHDFRPDYRRIRDVLAALSSDVAVLCTTATANDRVVADVTEQLRTGTQRDEQLTVYRGALARRSLRLEVVVLPEPAARLAWLATWLPRLPGSGIVYCLTKRDTETVAEWLRGEGISAIAYSGEVADAERVEAERRLLANDVKAVVATSALGMGYDKPDLGFVVHYQAPSSAIAYYQQVGRAGRGVEEAHVVLLRGAEDKRIQDFFIETAFPPRPLAERVLATLPATLPELQAEVNLGRGRIEAMLKVLDVEGPVRRDGSRWEPTGEPWEYDAARYEQVTALRRGEQQAMLDYGADGRCLMVKLLTELDDPAPEPCGRCSVCAGPRFAAPPDETLVTRARRLLRSRPVPLTVRRQTPKT